MNKSIKEHDMFYKILTEKEKQDIKELRQIYPNNDVYEVKLEKYLAKINYEDRLAEYLKDKWYIKLIKWFQGRKK